jgi:PadR family transcriptional regulator, regulatory protein PadR
MSLGDFEQVILFALVRLKGEAHGVAIAEEIERRTSRLVAPGGLYTVLERLEQKGFVTSWIGDSAPERGGRRRRVYRLEVEGAKAISEWYRGIQQLASGTGPWLADLLEAEK